MCATLPAHCMSPKTVNSIVTMVAATGCKNSVFSPNPLLNDTALVLLFHTVLMANQYDRRNWLIECLMALQHRKVNLCHLQGRETGSVG